MTHSGDWGRVLRDIKAVDEEENRSRYRDPPCLKCGSTGWLEVDRTPPDWWNSGPITEDVPCEDCPKCNQCRTQVDIDIHPSPFRLGWLGEGMVFCSHRCFGSLMRKVFDEEGKYYSSASYTHVRRKILDMVLDYDY